MSTAQRIVVALTLALAHSAHAQTDAPATSAVSPSPAAAPTAATPSASSPSQTESPTASTFPTPSQTESPTASPAPTAPITSTPSFSPRDCWDNFTEVFLDLSNKEPFSVNTYVICPNQVHDMGFRDGKGRCCENGEVPIIPRANTHYKCGADGSLSNNCTLRGGSFHIMFSDYVFEEELTGVLIEGFNFVEPQLHTLLAVGSGDVSFLNCVFKDQSSAAPVIASYEPDFRRRLSQADGDDVGQTPMERVGYIASDEYLKGIYDRAQAKLQAQSAVGADQGVRKVDGSDKRGLQNKIQVISFERCYFMNCTQGDYGELPPIYGVVSAITTYNAFVFKDCIFSNNNYDGTTQFGKIGYAITTTDTDTIMTNSCFIENNFFGYGTVQIFDGSSYRVEDNYVDGTDQGIKCQFIAYSSGMPADPTNVTCVAPDATSCLASNYDVWQKIRPSTDGGSLSGCHSPDSADAALPSDKWNVSDESCFTEMAPVGCLHFRDFAVAAMRALTEGKGGGVRESKLDVCVIFLFQNFRR